MRLDFSVKNYPLNFVSRLIALECKNQGARNALKETNLLQLLLIPVNPVACYIAYYNSAGHSRYYKRSNK